MISEPFDEPPYTWPVLTEEFSSFLDECASLDLPVRSSKLQAAQVEKIDRAIARLKALKAGAVMDNVEDVANFLFHFQCLLRSVQSALCLWMSLKKQGYEEAWRHLVDAQEYVDVALKIKEVEGARYFKESLEARRRILFPPWNLYNSAGYSETIGYCSICKGTFGLCDHLEGGIYMGTMCRRVGAKFIEANHSALVENPHDRRCILTHRSDDSGRMQNLFTLEFEEKDAADNDNDDVAAVEESRPMKLRGILMTTVVLDFD